MTNPDYDPDRPIGEAITAPQHDVDRELRREHRPIPSDRRPTARRIVRGSIEPPTQPATGAGPTPSAITPPPGPCASPRAGAQERPGGNGAVDGMGPPTDHPAGDPIAVLFTPAQAAELLQVRESWLRRRAARRLVPCTFLGKHLRFSRANLEQILADGACPAASVRHAAVDSGASPSPRRRARSGSRQPRPGQRPRSSGL